jgi:hypothetical protein
MRAIWCARLDAAARRASARPSQSASGRKGGLVVAAILAGCLVLGSSASAGASVRWTCTTGRTLFDRDSVRVFMVNAGQQEALVCPAGSSNPLVIANPGPANELQIGDFRFFGDRLGFDDSVVGLGAGGSSTSVGWVNLQTGEVRVGLLNASEHANYDLRAYAVAPDGATAIIADTRRETVAVLPVRAHDLGSPVVVCTTTKDRLAPNSLAITTTTVSWRTAGGTPGSAPRPTGSAEAATAADRC